MGFFNKLKGKGKDDSSGSNKNSKKKSSGKSKRGGKKQQTLIERMQLDESVAAATLDVVSDQADDPSSAIRKVEGGYIIVAFTNEMLEGVDLDPNGQDFGSFSEGLASEAIESISLASDLDRGVIGLIPSEETLLTIDEYDFVHDLEFRWALVPEDLDDDSELVLYDNAVSVSQLMNLSDNSDYALEVHNNSVHIVDSSEENNEQLMTVDVPQVVHDDTFEQEEIVDNTDNQDVEDDLPNEDEFEDDVPVYIPEGEDIDLDDDLDEDLDDLDNELEDIVTSDEEEEFLNAFSYGDGSEDVYTPLTSEEEQITAEDSQENVNRLTEHVFKNDELGLTADVSKFDDFFDSLVVAQFDTSVTDDSELSRVVSQLRKDANAEILRIRQDNIQALRNKYITSLHSIHDKLVDAVDHQNKNTTYGKHMIDIEKKFGNKLRDIEIEVANKTKEYRGEFEEDRHAYAQFAYDEALITYDRQHRDELTRKLDRVRDDIESTIHTNKDIKIGKMLEDRRLVSKRLYDRAMTTLMMDMQEQYQELANRELRIFDTFRKNIDAYMREHYSDEVLRAKAQAEALRQSHEAEKVRQEYEQMLTTKAKQMEEADSLSRENMRQLEVTHKEHVSSVRSDFERQIEHEQRDNQELRSMLRDLQDSNTQIISDKEKEVESRFKTYDNIIVSKDKELEFANQRIKESEERANNASKPLWYIVTGAGIVSLAIGILLGFLFGAGQTTPKVEHIAPGAEPKESKTAMVVEQDHFVKYDALVTLDGDTGDRDIDKSQYYNPIDLIQAVDSQTNDVSNDVIGDTVDDKVVNDVA